MAPERHGVPPRSPCACCCCATPHPTPRTHARCREGKTSWEDLSLDDVDVRLKWAGLFHRRKRTPGRFMMRLKVCAWVCGVGCGVAQQQQAQGERGGTPCRSGATVHARVLMCVWCGSVLGKAPSTPALPPPTLPINHPEPAPPTHPLAHTCHDPPPQVPNGELTAEQLRFLGDSIAPYGEDGCADITTRANIQVRDGMGGWVGAHCPHTLGPCPCHSSLLHPTPPRHARSCGGWCWRTRMR